MNKRKGFFRLTLVLSILIGMLFTTIYPPLFDANSRGLRDVKEFIFGFVLVWLIYALIRWVVMGFIAGGIKD